LECEIFKGEEVTIQMAMKSGLRSPFLVQDAEGLGLKIPDRETFTITSAAKIVGWRKEVGVIEVRTQQEKTLTMKELVTHYKKAKVEREVYNVLSMEFSSGHDALKNLVVPPLIVRKLDLLNTVGPHHLRDVRFPDKVQRYFLMSMEGSWTDFHVDFGGSSVWYHVVRGEKLFLLIPPTRENMNEYKKWISSEQQYCDKYFLGNLVSECYKVLLHPGQTFFIPTGWIHAVCTPADSLVFGGNFLHCLNIEGQIENHELERRTTINGLPLEERFLYPHFDRLCWYAAAVLLDMIRRDNNQQMANSQFLSQATDWKRYRLCNFTKKGLSRLIMFLEEWQRREVSSTRDRCHARDAAEFFGGRNNLLKELKNWNARLEDDGNFTELPTPAQSLGRT